MNSLEFSINDNSDKNAENNYKLSFRAKLILVISFIVLILLIISIIIINALSYKNLKISVKETNENGNNLKDRLDEIQINISKIENLESYKIGELKFEIGKNIEENNKLKLSIDKIEDDNNKLKLSIDKIDDDNKQLKLSIDKIGEDKNKLKLSIDKINDDNKQLKLSIDKMDDDNKQLKLSIDKIDGDNNKLKLSIDKIDDDNNQLKLSIDKMDEDLMNINKINNIIINRIEQLVLEKNNTILELNKLKEDLNNNHINISEKIKKLESLFEIEKINILSSIKDLTISNENLKSRLDCIESEKYNKNKYYYNLFKESTILTDDEKK